MPEQSMVVKDHNSRYEYSMESRHQFAFRSYSKPPNFLRVASALQRKARGSVGPIRMKSLDKRVHESYSKRDLDIDRIRNLSNAYTRSVFSSIRSNRYRKSVLENGCLSELFMFYHTLRTQTLVEQIKERYEEILSKDTDFQDHIYSLTPEGTRALFRMLEEPNEAAQETRKSGIVLLSDEQCAMFGKKPITLEFKLGPTKDEQ